MKPRHTAEQSTTNVNKAAKMGRVGFGALNFANTPAFSAPLQKSLEINEVAHTTPKVEPVTATVPEPIVSSVTVEEKVVVSAGGFSSVSGNVHVESVKIEQVEVKQEPVLKQATMEVDRNDYKPLGDIKYKNNPNIIYPEDPADGDNVCIACQ
jgi:hypothetical protein